jgi:hypothetical protein
LAASAAVAAAVAACSSSSASAESVGAPAPPPSTDPGDAGFAFDAWSSGPDGGPVPAGLASGVVVVHASANLPAFRLCFGNSGVAGRLLPLPDRELMPQSNVVGVDVGSAVRLPSFARIGLAPAPNGTLHHAYAIPERNLRAPRPANTPCEALICPGLGGDCLDVGQFYDLGEVPRTVYGPGAHVLAVGGCIAGSGDPSACGPGFDAGAGNPSLTALSVSAFARPNPKELPVQVLQLSHALAPGGSLTLEFGPFTGVSTTMTVAATHGSLSPPDVPQQLPFDPSDPQAFATTGFRFQAGAVRVAQSLASIQALSAPGDLPAPFYAVPSNFLLLLLGNPADTAPDGGPKTPTTDPGRVLHLLAVPVAAPGLDAGPFDAGVYEAGPRDAALSD